MKSLNELLDEMLQAIAAHHDAIIAHINSLPDSIKMDIIKEIADLAVDEITKHEAVKQAIIQPIPGTFINGQQVNVGVTNAP